MPARARKQNRQLWCVLWRFPLAFQPGNFLIKTHPLCSCNFSFNPHVSVVICTSMLHQATVTLMEEHLSLWDKLQGRSRRIISPWMIWLAPYLEADSLFYTCWPRLKVTQTSILRGGVKSTGTIDINPKNSRRKDIEGKPRTTFTWNFISPVLSLCANINHRCTKLLTTCFSLISLFSHVSCRQFHLECDAG